MGDPHLQREFELTDRCYARTVEGFQCVLAARHETIHKFADGSSGHSATVRHFLDPSPPRSTILSEAEALVYGERGKAYGHPSDDYGRTAALWTALLRGKLKEDLTPQDAILCMIAVKMSREVNLPGVDNRRDLAGYALCLDRVETGL